MSDPQACPHCGNRIGFAFGTCGQCGWNYIDGSFHWVRVYPREYDIDPQAIWQHASRTRIKD